MTTINNASTSTTTTKRARKSRAKNNANVVTGVALHNADTTPLTSTALALVVDADTALAPVSQVDVDAVLASINAVSTDDATDTGSLRDRALAVSQVDVDAMSDKVRAAFDQRDTFEASNGLDVTDSATSYAKAKRNMMNNLIAVSRGFIALNVEPVNVINRKVVDNKMFNAKALDKVTELCAFICGNASRFQKVTQAFIACAIAVADRDDAAIGNKVNKAFLSNASFDRLVNDAELATYLRDYQHKFMSGGRDTQSSQVRNVLDVLNLATIVTVDHARGGLTIERDHGFYGLFRERYMTAA